jgi:hypothetical protein
MNSQLQAKSSAWSSSAVTETRNRFKSAAGAALALYDALYVTLHCRYFHEMPWVALDFSGNDELKVASTMKRFAVRFLARDV